MGLVELLKRAFGHVTEAPEPTRQLDYVRTGAVRRFEVGSIFLEADGPARVIERVDRPDGTFNYLLRRFTPEETAVWEVLRS